jgi:hypothetical protein
MSDQISAAVDHGNIIGWPFSCAFFSAAATIEPGAQEFREF